MSKKGENIYKRKDGRWEGRYMKGVRDNGKIQYGYVYGRSYSDTKKRLTEVQGALAFGINPSTCITTNYSEILLGWLQSSKLRTKESTYSRYYYLVSKYISPKLGQYKVNQLSNAVMEKYIDGLARLKVSWCIQFIVFASSFLKTGDGLPVGFSFFGSIPG